MRSSATSNGCCETLLVQGSLATSPQSCVMFSTGSLYSIKSDTKSPYWLRTVFTASAQLIPVTFALRWLMPLDEPTYVQHCWRSKLGKQSFHISALTVWNSLPYSLKHSATSCEHFLEELKTCMFRKAYAPASENYIVIFHSIINPFTTRHAYMHQLFHCLQWYAGSERVKHQTICQCLTIW